MSRMVPGTYVSLAASRNQAFTLLLFVSRRDWQEFFLTYSHSCAKPSAITASLNTLHNMPHFYFQALTQMITLLASALTTRADYRLQDDSAFTSLSDNLQYLCTQASTVNWTHYGPSNGLFLPLPNGTSLYADPGLCFNHT